MLVLAVLAAGPGAAQEITPAGQRIEIEEGFFAFQLPDGWEAIPEQGLREQLKAFRWGFQHASSRRLGDLPLILVDYRPLQITPDTPSQWQGAISGESHYDSERHLLTASLPLDGGGWHDAVVRRAVFFGRSGAAIFFFVSSDGDGDSHRAEFDGVVDSFAFDPGYEWRSHVGWRLAAAGALVALLAALGIYLQRRFTAESG